jgi:hypothetical protein
MSPESNSSLFASNARSDASPSRHDESSCRFLDRVAGPFWDQCRALIDAWLSRYPESDQVGLRARLRSDDDRVFNSAFWELYLHEMYRRDGWAIEVEPTLPGVSTRPDFLVSKEAESYFVEARCTFQGNDRAAAARLQDVYASLDRIDSGAFHLAVTTVRIGQSSPSTKSLRGRLQDWLQQLDPDAGNYSLANDDPSRRYEWVDGDWHLQFHPVPRHADVRDVRAERPLGVFIPAGAEFIDDIGSLRGALAEKGAKYGELAHPLVLAVNVGSGFHDDLDTEQALYGTVGWRFVSEDPDAEPVPTLKEPGYWGWPGRPAHTHVAGVLLAEGMHYGRVAHYSPTFWPHPEPAHGINPLPVWKLAQPGRDGLARTDPAISPHVFFELPPDWPPGEPFPRRNVRG